IARDLPLHCHQLTIKCHVEESLRVLIPARLYAATRGDLKLPARSGERLNVDLKSARFVRLVCDPLAVGRELAIALVERSLKERVWFFVADHRKNPQIIGRLRILTAEQQKASIGGPVGWRFGLI